MGLSLAYVGSHFMIRFDGAVCLSVIDQFWRASYGIDDVLKLFDCLVILVKKRELCNICKQVSLKFM